MTRFVNSLAFLLRAHEIEVETYESGTVFLGVAPELKSGCVITDVRMPEISGIELLAPAARSSRSSCR